MDSTRDDIDGEAAGDWSGLSVSLSSDGKTLAIGAMLNDGAKGSDSGHVRVYGYIGSGFNSWGLNWVVILMVKLLMTSRVGGSL